MTQKTRLTVMTYFMYFKT